MHLLIPFPSLSNRVQSNRLEQLLYQSKLLGSDQADDIKSIKDKLDASDSSFQLRKDLLTKSDVDCLQKQFQTLSILEQECAKEQSILQSLTFDTRPVRHEQIAAAHERTFAWAFDTGTEEKNGSSFGEWLEQGNGIYWISGKPGSGKSTLMKFIADSPITSQLLGKWAKSSKLIIASHYFWLSGTGMQKSYQGLFQTLLYDIFRQMPPLIRQTCADRWTSSQPGEPWSLSELREAVSHIARNNSALRFCLFIDGMDEYDGNHDSQTQLCQALKDLAKSENFKLCLSSRPWNVFEEAFGHECPKLYVQNLTRDDIQTFVESRLEEHPKWAAVAAVRSQGQALVSEITEKSNGVFLWVFLVVKLLKQSLTNEDDMFNLQRRLRSFPSELEPFFKTILQSVDPFYHSHMSTALQVAIASDGDDLGCLVFAFLVVEHEGGDYAVTYTPCDDATIQKIKRKTTRLLDKNTHGLLEVSPRGNTVHFLHRTARDFLMTNEMREFLADKVTIEFNPSLSIIKALVFTVKHSPSPLKITRTGFGKYETGPDRNIGHSDQVSHLLEIAVKHAAKFELHDDHDWRHYLLLDELDRSLDSLLSEDGCSFTPRSLSYLKRAVLREQLVQHGLFEYLYDKIRMEPAFLADIGSLPPTRLLPERSEQGALIRRRYSTDVLAHILEGHGADSKKDDRFPDTSPWLQLFSFISNMSRTRQKEALNHVNFLLDEGFLMLSLKFGADPNVEVGGPNAGARPSDLEIRAPDLEVGAPLVTVYQGGTNGRAATMVYLKFCMEFVNQSQARQTLYFDVLRELLRSSNPWTLASARLEFTARMEGILKTGIAPRTLPFLAKVNNLLLHNCTINVPYMMQIKLRQDAVARQAFPPELYTPMEGAASSSDGSRQRQAAQRQT